MSAFLAVIRDNWRYLFAAIALTALVLMVGPVELVDRLRATDPAYLALYIIGLLVVPVAYGLQMQASFTMLGHHLDQTDTVRAAVSAWSIGLMTPARAGDLSLSVFLRPVVPVVTSTAVVLTDKLVSLAVLGLAAVATTFAIDLDPDLALGVRLSGVGVLALMVALIAAAASPPLHRLLLRVAPTRFEDRLAGALARLGQLLRHGRFLVMTVAIVTLRWTFLFGLNLVLFRSIGVDPPILVVVAATAVGRLVSLLPFSIGGVGLKEPVQILLYEAAGVADESVIAASVLGLALTYLAAAILPLAFRGSTTVRAT